MINLPKTTEFNTRIPKQKFYEHLDISHDIKRIFVEQVKTIYWRNKIATSTVNLAAGKMVSEIEVFEIQLSTPVLDEGMLRQIDKEIPYHILFLLGYQGKYQAWIGYKEAALTGSIAFKVNKYYHTEWMDETELPVKLDGLDIDTVYENFVRQIAGSELESDASGESLKDSIEREEKKKQLQKKITDLQNKIRKEKQFNKQMQLNCELKKLKREWEAI